MIPVGAWPRASPVSGAGCRGSHGAGLAARGSWASGPVPPARRRRQATPGGWDVRAVAPSHVVGVLFQLPFGPLDVGVDAPEHLPVLWRVVGVGEVAELVQYDIVGQARREHEYHRV